MKKICISLVFLFIIFLTAGCKWESYGTETKDNNEFLRIHIRANSNSELDQNIKYRVKDSVVNYLTPFIARCQTKNDAQVVITQKAKTLEYIVDEILKNGGFNYSSRIIVKNEKFPTRVYGEFTLESGYYDAVIVELGEATGDNWWCVVYPPLCFTSGENLRYKSIILEIIAEFKKRFCQNGD